MAKDEERDGSPRKSNIIESVLFGCTIDKSFQLIPGILLTVALVALVIWLTGLINNALGYKGLISYILIVIVLGILLRNLITIPSLFMPGIGFGVKNLLRLGIILPNDGPLELDLFMNIIEEMILLKLIRIFMEEVFLLGIIFFQI